MMAEIQCFMLQSEMELEIDYCHGTRTEHHEWVLDTVGIKSDGAILKEPADLFHFAIDAMAVANCKAVDPGAAVIPEGLCLVLAD